MLRAAGVSVALPFLESMTPAFAGDSASGNPASPPQRLVFVSTALGLYPDRLWPKEDATEATSPYLQLLDDYRKDWTLFSGLRHEDQVGRQPHDSEITFLTAARFPGMSGFRNSISVDQVAAKVIGRNTRFPSINLGTDERYSQSYTESGVRIPAETSPSELFAKLFIQGSPEDIAQKKIELQHGRSVLDTLRTESKRLRRKVSRTDHHLVQDYLESVRAAERSIGKVAEWVDRPKPEVDAPIPTDVGNEADITGRMEVLLQLIPLIIQTDSSRVITVMVHNHAEVPVVQGVTDGYHNLSHHSQDESRIEQLTKVETRLIENVATLLGALKSKSEGESSLLDRSSVLFGSNLGNANLHTTRNLPILVAGGGYKHQGFHACKSDTPLSNLFLKLLQDVGLESDNFGQSTGTLNWN